MKDRQKVKIYVVRVRIFILSTYALLKIILYSAHEELFIAILFRNSENQDVSIHVFIVLPNTFLVHDAN